MAGEDKLYVRMLLTDLLQVDCQTCYPQACFKFANDKSQQT